MWHHTSRTGGLSSDGFFDEASLILTSAGGDFNDDGLFNFFDVQSFLQAFARGCP